ncbi:MAG: L-fucose/L-arabinose isomerase family protein [Acidobacteriaceae bacterium]
MSNAVEHGSSKNIGVLIFGRKRPGFDQEWSKIIRERSLATLKELGFICVGADRLVLDDETIHSAMDEIEKAKCKALIVIQPSISDGQFALTIGQRWRDPVILWATPERPGNGKVSSCALVGQHLWASIYRQAHHPFEFVYGDAEDFHPDLLRAIALVSAVSRLRRAKVGVVGTHVPGFIDLAADTFLIRQTFGMQLHSLSLPQFIDRVGNVAEEAVLKDLIEVHQFGLTQGGETKESPSDELLSVNSRFYLSMTDLMKEMSLDALALQCWPELPNMLGQWPYFAVSRLTTAGKVVAIEGDVDGAIASLISSLLGFGPGFLTDWLEHDASTIFFWHPGMAPLDMCNAIGSEDGPMLAEHFNVARPFVVDGSLQTNQPVTISRLWRCDNRYHLTAFEGRAIPPKRIVSGNSLLVEVSGEETVPKRFDKLIHAGMPHHVLLHYGNHAETFRRFARLLNIEWHS